MKLFSYARLSGNALVAIITVLLCMAKPLPAQLPKAQGDIVAYSAKDVVTTQGTRQYTVPTIQQRTLWADIIGEMLKFNVVAAHTKAAGVGYQVTEFTDAASQKKYYVLEKLAVGIHFWGKYVVNPLPARPSLVIQSPHPISDLNTESQGAYIFKELGALLFCVAGTHRCNDTASSQCAGTTTVCSSDNSSRAFRRSDQAHNVDGMFQITTQVVVATIPKFIIVHVHGFDKGAGEPDVIISNGTNKAPVAPLIDYALLMKQQLQAIDAALTFKVAHVDLAWTELTGTTNMQGRLINNSTDPCSKSASAPSGQFVHVEQARIGLRDTPANWNKLTQAIGKTIPATVQASQLSATPLAISIGAVGGVLPGISITSNQSWSATSNQSWLQLSPVAGTGNAQVSGSAQANTTTVSRQATVTISGGGLQQNIIISQAGASAQLSATPLAVSIGAVGGVLPGISITSNQSWTATSNQSWVQLSPLAGTGNAQVSGNAQANTATVSRQATVTISGGGLQQNIIISQAGASAQLSATPLAVSIGAVGGALPGISITSNQSWTATSNQSWLQLSPLAGTGNAQVSGNAQANTTTVSRQATVTVSGGGLQQNIIISQAGVSAQLSAAPLAVNIGAVGGALPGISITSNTSWSATSNQSWLQLSPLAGTGNAQISGSVQANTTTTSRQAIVTLSGGGLQQNVAISQPGIVLNISTSRIAIPKAGRQNVAVGVSSNIPWLATTSQAWITIKSVSPTMSDTVKFDVAANPALSLRSGTITLLGFGQTRSLTVDQEANVTMTNVTMTNIASFTGHSTIAVLPNPSYEHITVRHTVHRPGSVDFRIVNSLGTTVLQQSSLYHEPG